MSVHAVFRLRRYYKREAGLRKTTRQTHNPLRCMQFGQKCGKGCKSMNVLPDAPRAGRHSDARELFRRYVVSTRDRCAVNGVNGVRPTVVKL